MNTGEIIDDEEEVSSNGSLAELSESDSETNEKILLSNEGYKNKSIIDFKEIDSYKKDYNDYSLFSKKKIAEELCKKYSKESNESIDDLLFLDETNKIIQNYHMQIAVEKLNSDLVDKPQKEILIEKIKKACIIINEKDFNENLKNINDQEIKKSLTYINYKQSLIKITYYF